jgi:hypothetical protein
LDKKYNKNFGKGDFRIRKTVGRRTCHSCGERIEKGKLYAGSSGMSYVNVCRNCLGEGYFQLSHQEIPLEEDLAQKQKDYEKRKEECLKKIGKEEIELFDARMNSILKDYSGDRIIKEVLARIRKKK